MKNDERALTIYQKLKKYFPNAHCELHHKGPFQLLIATILSAQCTDERVNMVTPILFKAFPTSKELANAKQEDVEEIIRSTGFFKNKARNIIGCARSLELNYHGVIPKCMDGLICLPGVGRKTANVLLGNAFNINEGIVVDTHVKRISNLLGLTDKDDPVKIEQDLISLFPQKIWTELSHLFIFLGRSICIARRPRCYECPVKDLCPSSNYSIN